MIIPFPSTFKAEFRRLRGAEISAMANRPDATTSDAIGDMLRSTWVKTIEPGPYGFDAAPQFDKLLTGDLITGLLWHAAEGVPNGRRYTFPVRCEQDHAKRQYEWGVDLVSQVLGEGDAPGQMRRLAPETIEHLRTVGNEFVARVAGYEVTYKLQSPADDKHIADLRKLVKRFTPAERLAVAITKIDGKAMPVRERWEAMLNLDGPDLYALFDDVDRKDCGVDTAISTRCPVCEWEQVVDLPFGRLFSPRQKPR